MPKIRNEVAATVADAFLPIENSALRLSADAGRCVALMIDARSRACLAPHVGASALALTAEGTRLLIEATNCFASAHVELAGLMDDLGLIGTAPVCPPNEGMGMSMDPVSVRT